MIIFGPNNGSYQMEIRKSHFLKTRNILVPTKMATVAVIALSNLKFMKELRKMPSLLN